MTLVQELVSRGFVSCDANGQGGDFMLQDDSDGRGAYIREWRSAQPCPFPELIREPQA